MPTGPAHERWITETLVEDCRCMVGEDHDARGDPTDGDGPPDAEEIWLSSGMDEDYDFR